MDGGAAIPIKKVAVGDRSFAEEVRKLQLRAGEEFFGETILCVTKALLQAGVAYIGGYPGAPMSHLIDVMADAKEEILEPMGIQFEQSASEAAAASLLSASIHYPMRGAVTWKSVVGTNVASDAISNLASTGVTGGSLIIIGEDYGEGSSIMQERTHAFAMKSSLPLIDPRYDMEKIVDLTERAFEMSEVSNLPVFFQLRIRACHMTGSFVAKDNVAPKYSARNPVPRAEYDVTKIVLPPASYAHEKHKFEERLPAIQKYVRDNSINEVFPGAGGPFGIITQGGTYSMVIRGLRQLGLADAYGNTDVPIMVLNVVYPLVPEELTAFMADKANVLVVEEGNPNFIESQIAEMAHRAKLDCGIHGKDVLPMAGEYTVDTVRAGLAEYLADFAPEPFSSTAKAEYQRTRDAVDAANAILREYMPEPLPARPPSFCTGCPERPIFAAMKLLMRERGPMHVSMDIGCNLFGALPPFHVGNTVLGYGLSLASGTMVGPALDQPTIAVMGDGGFWHNGVSTGAINAQWNKYDSVLIILENGYAAATGHQRLPSSGETPVGVDSEVTIENTLKGLGVKWIKRVDSYNLAQTINVLREAIDRRGPEMRVVISDNECMLARQRRERPAKAADMKAGKVVTTERFGVDPEVCTGDHSCMRLNGCPSLSLKHSADPLKETPIATVEDSCVACGHCGEVAHAAQLCPSFYRAEGVYNAGPLRRMAHGINKKLLAMMGACQ